jgi:hypothetical protein
VGKFSTTIFFWTTLCLAVVGSAQAQGTRTWVSGTGDDANPCDRTSPCKTFAGAIGKTAAQGEISAQDPGGFGTLTITKSITINGDNGITSVLASGINGFVINAGQNDVVVLRNLSINGSGTGISGIKVVKVGTLVVDNCKIYGFTGNDIDVSVPYAANILVKNSTISGGAIGAKLNSTAITGTLSAVFDHDSIVNTTTGVDALAGYAVVSNSTIGQNSNAGLLAETTGTVTGTGLTLTGNGAAVLANPGGTVRLSNSEMYDNGTGFGCGGGTLMSANNNRKYGNHLTAAPACAPLQSIVLQ